MGRRDNGRVVQLLRGGSWNNNPRNCPSAYRNHNQPDNANNPDNATNHVGFRVVCLPQHPSRSDPLEGYQRVHPKRHRPKGPRPEGPDPLPRSGVADPDPHRPRRVPRRRRVPTGPPPAVPRPSFLCR
jgi:hypothetical protein